MNERTIKLLQDNPEESKLLLHSSLKEYIKVIHYFMFHQQFIFKQFHLDIIKYLESFVFDIENTKNLIINIPVRCGKSSLVVYFVSYLLSIYKRKNIIYTSYDASLVKKYSTLIRNFISTDFYKTIFKQSIERDTKAKDEWKIVNGGEFVAKSLNSGLTGRGADFIICDDPIKAQESNSPTALKKNIENFNGTLKSRIDSKKTGRIILIMQRLNVHDLTGYLLENEPNEWDLIKIPALDNNNQSIFEERLPTPFLLKEKETNNFTFLSQYQQEPIITGGNVIKTQWFKSYDILPRLKQFYIVADTALKTGQNNDYSVFQLWGRSEYTNNSEFYLVDQIRGKWESPELLDSLLNFYEKYQHILLESFGNSINCLYIEDKASGTGLIQQVQRLHIPVSPVQVSKDKYLRLMDALPKIASGYVYLPKTAHWKNDFIQECEQFRQDMGHAHDDQIDCLSLALRDVEDTLAAWM